MFEYSLIILAAIAFPLLWSLAKKVPKLLARYMDWSKRAFPSEFSAFRAEISAFRVYSAETADGEEAEYIDEELPQSRKIVRSFRAFLISLYFLAIIYFLYMNR